MRILTLAAILFCFFITNIPYAYSEESKDERILLKLPGDIQEKMVLLMRDHIHALEDIIHAIQIEDYIEAEHIAESRLGWSASTRHGNNEIVRHWPGPMQEMADELYRAASNYVMVSKNAAIKADNQNAIAALGEVITACRSCHETYRIR